MDGMTTQDIVVILGGIGTLVASLGGAVKWFLTYIDEKAAVALKAEKQARKELRDYMDQEIKHLTEQLHKVTSRESLYLKRIMVLEAYILGQKGLELPPMEGWPPK
jgi:intracellular septation protein A